MQRVKGTDRRTFLKRGALAAGVAATGAGVLQGTTRVFAQSTSNHISPGDAAILRFLAAAEILETDLWEQYAELGGVPTKEIPGFTTGNPLYTAALSILDGDMAQYITDNTDDELTHEKFINAYLVSKGAQPVDLTRFATIPGSTATGSSGKKRLTNLMQLNVDTSFWTRYRDDAHNPDLDPNFVFPQAVEINNRTAIPRSDADLAGSSLSSDNTKSITPHLQAIAFTAGFHFAAIEQGGTSLYPSLAQRVSNPEALRVVLSIGPTEAMHFQTWQDKAGNALPVSDVDPITGSSVTFHNLQNAPTQLLKSNLIMPEPTRFLSGTLPRCSIVRPTETKGAAMGAVRALTESGLFIGQQNQAFFDTLHQLAEDADAAERDS